MHKTHSIGQFGQQTISAQFQAEHTNRLTDNNAKPWLVWKAVPKNKQGQNRSKPDQNPTQATTASHPASTKPKMMSKAVKRLIVIKFNFHFEMRLSCKLIHITSTKKVFFYSFGGCSSRAFCPFYEFFLWSLL